MSMIVYEQVEGEDREECCPICGSLGVVHFEDISTVPDMQHRCLRCNGGWDGCVVSSSDTLADRLTNSAQK
jgi:hypothetical protein